MVFASELSEPTRRKAWKSFAKEIVDWSLGGSGHWTVERDGTAIGLVGFSQPDDYTEPEIGWTLYDGFEGQGYATEAAGLAISWARGRLPELRLTYRDYGQAGRDDVGFRVARYAE